MSSSLSPFSPLACLPFVALVLSCTPERDTDGNLESNLRCAPGQLQMQSVSGQKVCRIYCHKQNLDRDHHVARHENKRQERKNVYHPGDMLCQERQQNSRGSMYLWASVQDGQPVDPMHHLPGACAQRGAYLAH